MNKNTDRGSKPKGVGRHDKYKQQNNDFVNNINKLDEETTHETTKNQNLHANKPNQKTKHNHVKADISSGKSNKRGNTTQKTSEKSRKSNAADTSPPASPRVNRGFLEQKAKRQKQKSEQNEQHNLSRAKPKIYGALDLGTNNCRLLLARPQKRGFRVVDSFSRIIRLGEGLSTSNRLSDEAMDRTIEALKICSEKMAYRGVHKSRLIATEACRRAENGAEFIHRVHAETGLKLEIIEQKTEAKLAVAGCAALLDAKSNYALVFDIGGGSSELILVEISPKKHNNQTQKSPFHPNYRIIDWTSLPIGVVTLSEKFGGKNVTHNVMQNMVDYVAALLAPFEKKHQISKKITTEKFHLLGTSGTVTTVAGIHLKLEQYDRRRIDGFWLESALSIGVTNKLIDMEYQGRADHPCIGTERADLVLAGCAIFNAIYQHWPAERTRVADRGLREGILTNLMNNDFRRRTNNSKKM